jgi:hypothetical protein
LPVTGELGGEQSGEGDAGSVQLGDGADGEVGFWVGDLLSVGLCSGVRDLEAPGDGVRLWYGDVVSEAEGDNLVEPVAPPTPDSEGSSEPVSVSESARSAVGAPSAGCGLSRASTTMTTVPVPAVANTVSTPMAITSRRVGLPRRDLSRPRS